MLTIYRIVEFSGGFVESVFLYQSLALLFKSELISRVILAFFKGVNFEKQGER